MAHTEGIPSPEIFRRWCAVAALGGAVQRRVYAITGDGQLFPNTFVLLVSPPGVGKSKAIDEVHTLWKATEKFEVGSDRLTGAALIDALKDSGKTTVFSTTKVEMTYSLLIASSEFGVLLPSHDTAFLNTLNTLYDCRPTFEDRTRMNGKIRLENPHISIIAGTQPKYMSEILPEGAWFQGFMSRMIMVYDDTPIKVDLFNRPGRSAELTKSLVGYLRALGDLSGKMTFDKQAASFIQQQHYNDIPPIPDHPKLQSYNSRRILHLLKLSMIYSLSESTELVVKKEHVDQALALLLDAEMRMPQIFTAMSLGSHMDAMNEAFDFCYRRYMRRKQPISESALVHFLAGRVPTNQISFYVDTMIRAKMLDIVDTGPAGRLFQPRSKMMED